MIINDRQPRIGDAVIYYDDSKYPHAATVAFVFNRVSRGTDRQICNLAIIHHSGIRSVGNSIEAAYHNGSRWVMINKWAFPDEIPDSEWSYLPPPNVPFKSLVMAVSIK